MKMRLRYVVEDTDRYGTVRIYFRRPGQRKIRLPGPVNSPEFLEAYRKACSGDLKPPERVKEGAAPGTLRALCIAYYASGPFQQLEQSTRTVRRGLLDRFCQNKNDGDKPFALLLPRHIRARRDALVDRPEAANGMIKALRQLFKFAIAYDLHDRNPAAEVEYLSGPAGGHHSWTLSEIEQFEAAHPVGTKARLALGLALYTGQRRSDLVQLGPLHVQDGWLSFTQHKGRKRHPVHLEIPIIPRLQTLIDASPTGAETFLVTDLGKPFTADGFGNKFREWTRAAGLTDCPLHGLRKAAAARLAELGCSEFEIAAITGHTTLKEVSRYTRAARQRIRAESALKRLI